MRLKKPTKLSIGFLIFGIIAVSLAVYAISAFQNEIQYLTGVLLTGDFMGFLNEIVLLVEESAYLFTGFAMALIILAFLMFYGVYVDMANRTGFPVLSRKKLFVSPLLYTITILVTAFPIAFLSVQALLGLQLTELLIWFIPVFLAAFGLLILVGSLPLWILHIKQTSLKNAFLLSARLMLSPLIDAFWSAAASFVGIAIALPILMIATMTNMVVLVGNISGAMNQSNVLQGIIDAFRSLVNFAFSDWTYLVFMIPFVATGILMSIHIYRRGPSYALADFFLLMGVVLPISTVAATIVLSSYLGSFALLFWLVIIIPLAIVCVILFAVYWGSAFLTAGLGISGVFGLLIAILSGLFLALTFGILPNIPIVGPLVVEMISQYANWLNIIAAQIGTIGVAAGIIIIILSFKVSEEKQVFSQAMAISVGVSTTLPFLLITILHLPGIFGGLIGVVLVFALISPTYLLSVSLLRLRLAINTFINPENATKAKYDEDDSLGRSKDYSRQRPEIA